jgi:hypothetical protein
MLERHWHLHQHCCQSHQVLPLNRNPRPRSLQPRRSRLTAKKAPAKSAARPAVTKPTAAKPTAAKPTATKPAATKPAATKPAAAKSATAKSKATEPAAVNAPVLPKVPHKEGSKAAPFTVKVPLSIMPTVLRFSRIKGMTPEQYIQALVDESLDNRGRIGQPVIHSPSFAEVLVSGPSGSVKVDAARY